ncbi:MAG: DUF503 domain-containing protein [Fusobacteriota bacterium]
MYVGVMSFEIIIQSSTSLKDKRKLIRKIKDKIFNKYGIKVYEVDYNDDKRRGKLAISLISNTYRDTDLFLEKLKDYVLKNIIIRIYNFKKDITKYS